MKINALDALKRSWQGNGRPLHLRKLLGTVAECQVSGYSGYKSSTIRGERKLPRQCVQIERLSTFVSRSKYTLYNEFILLRQTTMTWQCACFLLRDRLITWLRRAMYGSERRNRARGYKESSSQALVGSSCFRCDLCCSGVAGRDAASEEIQVGDPCPSGETHCSDRHCEASRDGRFESTIGFNEAADPKPHAPGTGPR